MKLTDKQRLFCIYFNESGIGAEAATKAGYSKDTAASQASRMLRDVKVIQYMEFIKSTIEKILIGEAKNALATIIELRDSKKSSGTVRLRAAQDLLDRAGYKSSDKIRLTANVTHNGSVASTIEIQIIQELVNTNEELAGDQ